MNSNPCKPKNPPEEGFPVTWCVEHEQSIWTCIAKRTSDPINPSYYKGDDAMQIIERYNLDFTLGSAIKYILRAGKKDGEDTPKDLRKSLWYIQRRIKQILSQENYTEEGLIYLASPYSHDAVSVRETRYNYAVRATAMLMNQGLHVYSPIVHNHPIAQRYSFPQGWDYWEAFDGLMLSGCSKMYILTIEGWTESKGIAAEVEIARELQIPISLMSFRTEEPGYSIQLLEDTLSGN